MGSYKKLLKQKFTRARVYGTITSIWGIILVLLYFLSQLDKWLLIVMIGYSLGAIFMSNITYQDIKSGNPWPKINAALAILFYLVSIGLMIYGFVIGELSYV